MGQLTFIIPITNLVGPDLVGTNVVGTNICWGLKKKLGEN